jgi:hypothetical protein
LIPFHATLQIVLGKLAAFLRFVFVGLQALHVRFHCLKHQEFRTIAFSATDIFSPRKTPKPKWIPKGLKAKLTRKQIMTFFTESYKTLNFA